MGRLASNRDGLLIYPFAAHNKMRIQLLFAIILAGIGGGAYARSISEREIESNLDDLSEYAGVPPRDPREFYQSNGQFISSHTSCKILESNDLLSSMM